MTLTDERLPSEVARPLRMASVVLLAFIAGVTIWAVMAPLATTLNLTGRIVSSRPSFELQHPYGGRVAEVLVDAHDRVRGGDVVMRLDNRLERENLSTHRSMKARIERENAVIDTLLETLEGHATVPDFTHGSLFYLRHQQAMLQRQLREESADNLALQARALRGKIRHATAQLALMADRARRKAHLADQGLMLRSDHEQLQEQILIVQGEIESDFAALHALEDRRSQSVYQAELTSLSLNHELSAKREENLTRLDELAQAIVELEDQITRAEIRAPIDGTVTDVLLEAEDMYAARGETLMMITQPLARPHLAFDIPVGQIDQVRPGMSGRLIIPSLPQRAVPRIDVAVAAISPRAKLDEAGNPISYGGLAVVEAEALDGLRAALDLPGLSEDMPVNLIIEVRETTFAQYLLTPLASAFGTALQD